MEEIEIQKMAEEMIVQSVADQVAAELTRQSIERLKRQKCDCCGSINTRKHKTVEGVWNCKNCNSVFGEGFQHKYPKWAQGNKKHFRKFISLKFNIQG
jgi:ribosomal protein L37AE/L43A